MDITEFSLTLPPIFIQLGLGDVFSEDCIDSSSAGQPQTRMQLASLSAEKDEASEIYVALFEIESASFGSFETREPEFRYEWIAADEIEVGTDNAVKVRALMCCASSDEEYKCKIGEERWKDEVEKYGITSVWRKDILPCRSYLRHCVLSAKKLSPAVYANFLDNTFLSDRLTTIRHYLADNPTLMDEEPPASVGNRYNG